MRVLLLALLLALSLTALAPAPARADACDDLTARIAGQTGAKTEERRRDYATFSAGPDTTLTFACGAPDLSSIGAQFRGAEPTAAYYELFGKAGNAVTGIDAAVIVEAAHRARGAAARLRHSNVDLGGALVTCSSMVSPDKGPLTLCAVIEHSKKS